MKKFFRLVQIIKNKFQPIFPDLFRFMTRYRSLVKFLISGFFAGGSDLLFLFIFHGVFNLGTVISTSLAFIISFVISFNLQKYWAFDSRENNRLHVQLILYMAIAFINLSINAWVMHILVNQYNIWYLLAQLIVTISLGLESFVAYKFIIFRNTKIKSYEVNSKS